MAQNPLLKNYNYLYYLLSVLLLGVVQVFYVQQNWEQSPVQSIWDATLHWSLLGLLCFGLINAFSFFHPPKYQLLIVLGIPLVMAPLWVELSRLLWTLIDPAAPLEWLNTTRPYRLSVGYLIIAGAVGFSLLWFRVEEKQAREQRRIETERRAREAELFKLRQQIQPHFLFNALNSINSLIGSRPKDARTMVQKLSEFLRGTLRRDEGTVLELQEELHHLNLYLDLEQLRFGHRLSIERDIQADSEQARIPPLILQPLVENAIKYGLYGTTEALTISLRIWLADHALHIQLENPYDPEHTAQGGTGFGLQSTHRRLFLLYGRKDLLQIEQENKIFRVKLKIPQSDV